MCFTRPARAATAICFPRGRIHFLSPAGDECSPTQGQAFFYFGDDVKPFGSNCSAEATSKAWTAYGYESRLRRSSRSIERRLTAVSSTATKRCRLCGWPRRSLARVFLATARSATPNCRPRRRWPMLLARRLGLPLDPLFNTPFFPDVATLRQTLDVKQTGLHGRYLIWPVRKNDIFATTLITGARQERLAQGCRRGTSRPREHGTSTRDPSPVDELPGRRLEGDDDLPRALGRASRCGQANALSSFAT